MALSKHLRVERQVPSFYLMVTGAILIGFFLIAVWVLSPATLEGSDLVTNELKTRPEEKQYGTSEKQLIDTKSSKEESGTSSKQEFVSTVRTTEDTDENNGESDGEGRENLHDAQEKGDGEEDKLDQKQKVHLEGKQKKLQSGKKVDNDGFPEVTTAAQSELTTENKETPKNWSTQASESTEEKELVKISTGGIENSTKKEGQDREQSGNKVDNDEFPEVTTAAQSELTTENKETPKNWSTQASESTEEKELVKISTGGIENSTKKGGQDREQFGQKDSIVKGDPDSLEQDLNKDPDIQLEKSKDEPREKEGFAEVKDFEDQTKDKHKEKEIIEPSSGEQKGVSEKPLIEDGSQPTSGEKQKVEELFKTDGWNICKSQGAADYIPCLDNKEAIRKLRSIRRFQHRERHCPAKDSGQCLVPLPKGYTLPIRWPRSRDEIWLNNVPHTKLVTYKKDQNWVKVGGDKLVFPGGGTQFKNGASQYINNIEQSVPDIAWGRHTRVVLDVGCGVASFGGYLFEKDVLTMSFAPKDEHEAQVQLALERGIPAFLAVMGTQRLVFPSNVYDMVHCARCRVHWHGDGGKLLMEVNRVLRPGGYFVWSATPVYQGKPEDDDFWNAVQAVTRSICWGLVIKTMIPGTGVGFAIYQKPKSNACYEEQSNHSSFCDEKDKPDAAWYVPMENCIYKISMDGGSREAEWPANWPERLDSTPKWLNTSGRSLFGKPAGVEFQMDTEHWRHVIDKSYLKGLGIDWSSIRNVMDMNAHYGGFGAALTRQPLWVMNVVPLDEPDTLPVIFDRGLIGVYHDWCESFSTYPRTYDLLHVDHLFKRLISRCDPVVTVLEIDRILRPEGWVIIRDKSNILDQIHPIIKSLHWTVHVTYVESGEELLVAQKGMWRPEDS